MGGEARGDRVCGATRDAMTKDAAVSGTPAARRVLRVREFHVEGLPARLQTREGFYRARRGEISVTDVAHLRFRRVCVRRTHRDELRAVTFDAGIVSGESRRHGA